MVQWFIEFDFRNVTMTLSSSLGPSAIFELTARIPINSETQNLPRGGRNFQTPKWYQFKPRSILGTPWLEGLLECDEIKPRNRIILADEGGVGKTKASAITVNHILSKHPDQPILIVCPRRVIPDWKSELKGLMRHASDRIVGGDLSGAKSVLTNPLPGHIYVVSKHSLSLHLKELEHLTSWKQLKFSLVVIDEAHQGKADVRITQDKVSDKNSSRLYEQEFGNASSNKSSNLYGALKTICNQYSERALAVTASPLSLKLDELVNLAKLIGVEEKYYAPLIVSKGEGEEDKFLEKWTESLKPCKELFEKSSVSKNDIQNFKSQMIASGSIKLLPHQSEVEAIFSSDNHSKWLEDENKRRNWIKELMPLATFVTATLRADLGQESEELFRKRVTWTQFVKLHKTHTDALDQEGENKSNLAPLTRYNQSWPTNHMGDSNPRCYDSGFDYEDSTDKSDCPEPRIGVLLKKIFPSDPAFEGIRLSEKRKGAVIFSNTIRTVYQISRWINGQILSIQGKNIKIVSHVITGDVDSAVNDLKEIESEKSVLQNEYHVVIGTSAIQEGLSMNWATTVVHWDLVSNPQTLEQRTWRLDRHKKSGYHDSFNTVYLVTDTKSDKEMVKRIIYRAGLASKILGQVFHEEAWPNYFEESKDTSPTHTRVYTQSKYQYFHPKAIDFAGIWMNTGASEMSTSEQIRKLQQQAIFIGLSESNNWGLDIPMMLRNNSIECINLQDPNNSICVNLRKMMVLANNHDRSTLQSLHPQQLWELRPHLDWQTVRKTEVGRFFSASFEPSGEFIQRVLRRIKNSELVIKGPSSKKKMVVFTIDCSSPLPDFEWELDNLDSLINQKMSSLYKLSISEGEHRRIFFQEDSRLLLNMLRAAVNQNTMIYNPVAIESVLAQCIQNKIHNIESRIEELDIYYDQLDLSGDRYQQHYEESYDIQYLSMKEANDVKISQTDELMKTLESWKNHLDFAVEKNSYSINPIYVEGYK